MKLANEVEFIVGIYGRMQLEMLNIGLLHEEDASPKSMKYMDEHERDAIKIYDYLAQKVRHISAQRLNEISQYTNDIAKKLVNEDTTVNNYLLSLMLFRLYLQEVSSKYEFNIMMPKVERQLIVFEKLAGETYGQTRKVTSRVADNMWRVFTGKAQLSDEIRDLRVQKFKRN